MKKEAHTMDSRMTNDRIHELKILKNAVILAHNYQAVEIQRIADFCGDSLQLSIQASTAEADIIVFCGVRFMAETAAILNPNTKVLLPVPDAGCPMADMIDADTLKNLKAMHPNALVVCYVNSSAEIKAESDICCTSSNALKIVQSIPPGKEIIFVPDQNLGSWVSSQAKRNMIIYNGYCPVHHFGFSPEMLEKKKQLMPDYTFLAHPECQREIVEQADLVMSTSGMLKYAETHDNLIIATEQGLIDYLNYLYPGKNIVCLSQNAICQNMKKTHLSDVLTALEQDIHPVQVEKSRVDGAVKCLNRMLDLS